MPSSTARGQASAEYVTIVAVVALLLAVSALVTTPDLRRTVVDRLERALCVVGLDVCDAGQARAEGLAPCVTSSEDRTRGTSFLITAFDTGGSDRLLVEVRSDGSYLVTASHETRLGASVGLGLDVKGLADVGGELSGGGAFGSGTTLEVPDAAALRALLGDAVRDPAAARAVVAKLDDDYPAERVTRYRQLDGRAGVTASVDVLGGLTDVEGAAARPQGALGVRTRAGVRTYYYDVAATLDGPLGELLPLQRGRLVASWEAAEPPVLTVTSAGSAHGRESVLDSRMVLTDPEDRRLARRWLLTGGPVADSAGRALAARMDRAATVQRLVYARQEVDEGAWNAEAKLGIGGGMEHLASVTRRQLVDARLLSRPVGGRRLDCLSSFSASASGP